MAKGAAIQGGILLKIKCLEFYNMLEIKKKSSKIGIENLTDSPDYINKFKEIENSIDYVDINLYKDTIKDLVVKTEEYIINLSKRNNIDLKQIKENNKLILEKFGNFIQNQLKQNIITNYEQKLILSYIKYYFIKLTNYLQIYKDDTFKNEIIKDKTIDNILKEIEFYNSNIIFEIIEDFSDEKEIFEKCLIGLIQNLYGKFTLNSENKDFKQINLDDLQKIKKEIDNILILFGSLNSEEIPVEIKYVKDYLKAFQTKVEVKEFILKYYNDFKFYGFEEKTENYCDFLYLIKKYKKSLNIDEDLMNELINLYPDTTKNKIYNKYDAFLKKLENLSSTIYFSYIDKMLYQVFMEFKVIEISELSNGNNIKFKCIDMSFDWKDNSLFLLSDIQRGINFLNDTLIKYNKSYELIKEHFNDEKMEKVYQKIISSINLLKDKVREKKYIN